MGDYLVELHIFGGIFKQSKAKERAILRDIEIGNIVLGNGFGI